MALELLPLQLTLTANVGTPSDALSLRRRWQGASTGTSGRSREEFAQAADEIIIGLESEPSNWEIGHDVRRVSAETILAQTFLDDFAILVGLVVRLRENSSLASERRVHDFFSYNSAENFAIRPGVLENLLAGRETGLRRAFSDIARAPIVVFEVQEITLHSPAKFWLWAYAQNTVAVAALSAIGFVSGMLVTVGPPNIELLAEGRTVVVVESLIPQVEQHLRIDHKTPEAYQPMVRELQLSLVKAGYGPLKPDGQYGKLTHEKVVKFLEDRAVYKEWTTDAGIMVGGLLGVLGLLKSKS